MAAVQSRAHVSWEGNLVKGHGHLNLDSGVITERTLTWRSRTERTIGNTSPEELLAAAHAGCYAMALAHALTQLSRPPIDLEVQATGILDEVGGQYKITAINLEVVGQVPGLDQTGFEEAARSAESACPVSNALRNNVVIHLKARLGGAEKAIG